MVNEGKSLKRINDKHSASEELNNLIGLNDVKRAIDNIVSSAVVDRLRKSEGLVTKERTMNMVFMGNPGTAKTTVAHLLYKILKENNIITTSKFIYAPRQALVAKYVGHTSTLTEEVFEKAVGTFDNPGVLFIDEAYSLSDDAGGYGLESINTLTELMEKQRGKVIVILAGYTDKMKEFLSRNTGLESRISYYLNFNDYSLDELADILKHLCKDYNYSFTSGALNEAKKCIKSSIGTKCFGNGRFVRNLLEKSIDYQSSRVKSLLDAGKFDDKIHLLKTITKDDVGNAIKNLSISSSSNLGFC